MDPIAALRQVRRQWDNGLRPVIEARRPCITARHAAIGERSNHSNYLDTWEADALRRPPMTVVTPYEQKP